MAVFCWNRAAGPVHTVEGATGGAGDRDWAFQEGERSVGQASTGERTEPGEPQVVEDEDPPPTPLSLWLY